MSKVIQSAKSIAISLEDEAINNPTGDPASTANFLAALAILQSASEAQGRINQSDATTHRLIHEIATSAHSIKEAIDDL